MGLSLFVSSSLLFVRPWGNSQNSPELEEFDKIKHLTKSKRLPLPS